MSSVVYYKFKNTKDDWKSISFEGPYISALEVKKQITLQQHFSDKHCDFHLLITNAENKDEFQADTTIIPRNTTLFVKRVPALKAKTIIMLLPENKENQLQKENQPLKENCSQKIPKGDQLKEEKHITKHSYKTLRNTCQTIKHGNRNIHPDFFCSICSKLLEKATMSPCCRRFFCDHCIRSALLTDYCLTCPKCFQTNLDLDQLQLDLELQEQVNEYKIGRQKDARNRSRSREKNRTSRRSRSRRRFYSVSKRDHVHKDMDCK